MKLNKAFWEPVGWGQLYGDAHVQPTPITSRDFGPVRLSFRSLMFSHPVSVDRSRIFSFQDERLFLHSPGRKKKVLSRPPCLHKHGDSSWTAQAALEWGLWGPFCNSVCNSPFANYSYNASRQVRVYLSFRGGSLQLVELNVSSSASGEPARAIH